VPVATLPESALAHPVSTTGRLCAATALGALLAVGYAQYGGASPAESWQLAARYTARFSFMVFLLVFLARPWNSLAPSTLSRTLLLRRRSLGLAFATAHSVHLAALTTFFVVKGTRPAPITVIVGGGAYLTLYAMAATSSDAAVRLLGRNWRRLHTFGVYYLWFVFAFTYGARTFERGSWYAPFFATAIAALGLRLVARRKRRVWSAAH
jgi:methionine sulfoxide reductase heme-binding subunit